MKKVEIIDYYGKKHFVPVEDSVYEVMTGLEFNEKAQDRRHDRHRAKVADGGSADPEAYPAIGNLEGLADVVIEREEQRVLHDAIAKLKPDQRRRVYMYMMQMSYEEIARAENIDASSTRKALLRSFKKLRRLLNSLY